MRTTALVVITTPVALDSLAHLSWSIPRQLLNNFRNVFTPNQSIIQSINDSINQRFDQPSSILRAWPVTLTGRNYHHRERRRLARQIYLGSKSHVLEDIGEMIEGWEPTSTSGQGGPFKDWYVRSSYLLVKERKKDTCASSSICHGMAMSDCNTTSYCAAFSF